MAMIWLGSWNDWKVLLQDGQLWLVNPLTGHRWSCNGPAERAAVEMIARRDHAQLTPP